MTDRHAALETVIRHAVDLENGYNDIAPTVTALASCGDTTLLPRLHEVLDRFLNEENFYGRDLIAEILAGIHGMAALPALLRASARDLGDDQDSLSTEITELLYTDRAASRPTVLEFATSKVPTLRHTGLWALGFVAEPQDIELLAAAAADTDPKVRSTAIGSLPDPAGDDRTFHVLVLALRDPDEQVRLSAASRLGYTGRADAVAPLAARTTDQAPQVRSTVAHALGRLGDRAATPALLRLLGDPDPHVREYATDALGSIGGPAAVDALLTLAADKGAQLRLQAAEALATAVDSAPRAAPQITTLAEDDETPPRTSSIGPPPRL